MNAPISSCSSGATLRLNLPVDGGVLRAKGLECGAYEWIVRFDGLRLLERISRNGAIPGHQVQSRESDPGSNGLRRRVTPPLGEQGRFRVFLCLDVGVNQVLESGPVLRIGENGFPEAQNRFFRFTARMDKRSQVVPSFGMFRDFANVLAEKRRGRLDIPRLARALRLLIK